MEQLGFDPEEGTEYENYLVAIQNMKLEYSDEEMIDVIRRVFFFKPGKNESDVEIRRAFYE